MAMAGELEHVDLGPPEIKEEVEEAEARVQMGAAAAGLHHRQPQQPQPHGY